MYHRGTISHSEHRPHFQSVLQSIIKDNIKISGNVITEFFYIFSRDSKFATFVIPLLMIHHP